MIRQKRGQTEYAWLFSLIVGALIIFLAVFAAQKFKGTSTLQTQAEILREFDILLNPFSSVGSITTMTLSKAIELPSALQLNFSCNSADNYNEINVRSMVGRGWGEWLRPGFRVRDKYIFSELVEGRTMWVFAKPFEMPWRVDDLIYITDQSYCFDDPPSHIQREVEALKTNSIFVRDREVCPPESVEVCFGARNCDININYPLGIVRKGDKSLFFAGDAMMYSAIFSGPELYECNSERLVGRIKTQIEINSEKARILKEKGCSTDALLLRLEEMKRIIESGGEISGDLLLASLEAGKENPRECPVFD